MFCYNCGQKLVDGAKFCSSCGTKISGFEQSAPAPQVVEQPAPAPAPAPQVVEQPAPAPAPAPAPQVVEQPAPAPAPAPQSTPTGGVPASSPNKIKWLLLLFIVAVAGIGIWMAIEDERHKPSAKIGDYGSAGPYSSPEATFQTMMSAIQRQDVSAAVNCLTSSNKNRWDTDWIYDTYIYSYTIVDKSQSGNNASIKARVESSDGTRTITYRFVKENGKWLLYN